MVSFIGQFCSKWCFGNLGENVTLEVRKLLYKSILRKHIGFHDFRDNGTSVLTSAMAEDSAIINGVSTESLGPMLDGAMALVVGLVIGFIYCWQEALICLGVAPLMIVSSAAAMALESGTLDLQGGEADKTKAANLLAGDAIVNFKTVQSFGHEDRLVEKYNELLSGSRGATRCRICLVGMTGGFSQFVQFCIFAVLFFCGGLIIEDNYPEI